MRIGKIIKNLKNLGSLKVEDKDWLAKNKLLLFEFVKNYPVREAVSGRQPNLERYLKLILKPMPIIVGVLIAALLGGGGVAYASQNSLPGDTLYPVKLVTEDLQTAIAWNPEKKMELEAKFANRRLEEIKKLQGRLKKKGDEIPKEVVEKALNQANKRLEKAQERIEKMEEGALKEKALEAASRLEKALETHEQILSDLAGEVPKPALETLLHAQEVAAKHSVQTLEKILRLEKAEEVHKRLKEKGIPRIEGAKERAEGKLKALKNRLEALENYVDNLEKKGIEINEDAHAKLNEANEKVKETEKLIEEEKYLEAFEAAHQAMRLMMETQLFLRRPASLLKYLPTESLAPAPAPLEPTPLPTSGVNVLPVEK